MVTTACFTQVCLNLSSLEAWCTMSHGLNGSVKKTDKFWFAINFYQNVALVIFSKMNWNSSGDTVTLSLVFLVVKSSNDAPSTDQMELFYLSILLPTISNHQPRRCIPNHSRVSMLYPNMALSLMAVPFLIACLFYKRRRVWYEWIGYLLFVIFLNAPAISVLTTSAKDTIIGDKDLFIGLNYLQVRGCVRHTYPLHMLWCDPGYE